MRFLGLALVTLYVVITGWLLLSSFSRSIFSEKRNYLTIWGRDIMVSLLWPVALFSEWGFLWLVEMLSEKQKKQTKVKKRAKKSN